MNESPADPEPFPDVDAAGALRAAFRGRVAPAGSASARRDERKGYDLKGEIARGGMGVIVQAFDRDLTRDVALKVLRDELAPEPRLVRRFLEEARVTARLDHPGIVPVHEAGWDADGRPYFAMRLVRGRDLGRIMELANAREGGWSRTRALSVFLKVCEAMAYAHGKGVLHRDLKPSNVMVGEFGEVYVMDWGLARAIGHPDPRDLRWRDRPNAGDSPKAESPIVTMDGEVLGTPCYMSPEQAQGRIAELGPRSDVYSVGAMLYHLLAGEMPYVPAGRNASSRAVLRDLVQGPPRPLDGTRRDLPGELIAICERAMARDPRDRYAGMSAMAEDLRAFLESRVVRAYETGAWAEARKWIRRNKGLAAASAAAVSALACGLVASLILKSRSDHNEGLATERADDVLRLSAFQDLDDLAVEADQLWPVQPEMIPRYVAWLDLAKKVVDELPAHERKLSALRAGALEDTRDKWWHNQLQKLVEGLKAFSDPEHGLFSSGISSEHGWGVKRRLDFARTIEEESVGGPEAEARWSTAIASIGSEAECPIYQELVLAPQIGLLPIGQDPVSGLWEFAHLQTGEPARRDPAGKLMIEDGTGIVLVLIPGGTFWMGAQGSDPLDRNYDPSAGDDEKPVHEVTLSPYFVSKYEMTQGQWSRLTGSDPSVFGSKRYSPTWNKDRLPWSALHPVEEVSWTECGKVLARASLVLPTEARWECACRAGTSTVFWSGDEPESLLDAANLSDSFAKSHGSESLTVWEDWLDDGNTLHARIGAYRANAYGLHDIHGNVWEWCQDGHGDYGATPPRPGDGGREVPGATHRVYRGGSFSTAAIHASSAFRFIAEVSYANDNLGLRPARDLLP